jgi:hypothetical protein
MNKSISKKNIALLALLYNATIFGMNQQLITYNQVSFNQEPFTILSGGHLPADITKKELAPELLKLPKEEIADLRSVNKALAQTNSQWKFMPDRVEKEIDAMKKKYGKIISKMKTQLLCKFACDNDNDAVEWLINVNTPNRHIFLNFMEIKPSMFALHNNNYDMQKLLIESDNAYKGKSWKTCPKLIIPPTEIKTALYPSNAYDFSFLPYMMVVSFDDQSALKQLYSKQIPTYSGQKILINLALEHNAHDCFGFLLENETAKDIIKENPLDYFNGVVQKNHQQIAQQLIDHELYDVNEKNIEESPIHKITILDLYDKKKSHHFYGSGYDNARALLKDLKKYQDDKKNQQHQRGISLNSFDDDQDMYQQHQPDVKEYTYPCLIQ